MKKYRRLFDFILLAALAGMSLLAIAPKTVVMPTSLQMFLLAIVLALTAGFLALLWREQPADEREAVNQTAASRLAYMTGVVFLIIVLVVQSFQHALDSALPVALLLMIGTKVIAQRTKDAS